MNQRVCALQKELTEKHQLQRTNQIYWKAHTSEVGAGKKRSPAAAIDRQEASSLDLVHPLFEDDGALFGEDADGVFTYGDTSLGVEDYQAGKASHGEVTRRRLHALVLEGERKPGHLPIVGVKL